MNRRFTCLFLLAHCLAIFFLMACKKNHDAVADKNQLLLSRKYPLPIANKKIEIYQGGSPGIPFAASAESSTASAVTDANGNFQLAFRPGHSTFLIFQGRNGSPLVFQNSLADTSFPKFSRMNFPDSLYSPSTPIYVGKVIDTVILKTILGSDLSLSDTIGLQTSTINGVITREYTGLTGRFNEIITLDTIYNMLFTNFDCLTQKFSNSLYAGRKWTTVRGYSTINGGYPLPAMLSTADETKMEMLFTFIRYEYYS